MTTSINGIAAALVALGVIAAVTVLTWHGSIDGQAAIGIFGAILGGVGIGAAQHTSFKTGAKVASPSRSLRSED